MERCGTQAGSRSGIPGHDREAKPDLAIADTPEFTAAIARQNEAFTTLVPKLGIQP